MRDPVRCVRDDRRRARPYATLVFAVVAAALLLPTAVAAAKSPSPTLNQEHLHPSGTFSFRTPNGWKVGPAANDPAAMVAAGDGLVVRFVFHGREVGYDALHGICMLERLAGPMDTFPAVKYEYDYVGGVIANRRALDSVFTVQYDAPVLGANIWRQRNVTIVGEGQALCLVGNAPLALWKKSAETRALHDAVLGSVAFR